MAVGLRSISFGRYEPSNHTKTAPRITMSHWGVQCHQVMRSTHTHDTHVERYVTFLFDWEVRGGDLRSDTEIHVVSCHAEGDVGDVIVSGVARPRGGHLGAVTPLRAERF